MTAPLGIRSRGLTRCVAAVLFTGLLWAMAVVPASAAETSATPVQLLQRGPLLSFSCNDCHAKISDTLVPNHIFSHGAHMTYDCIACHPRFPHDPSGTQRPAMVSCFACHGLRHGPQGIVAGADCTKCHTLPRAKLIPKDHVAGYKGKPHVIPGKTELRTSCMLCHTKAQCDACHLKTKVSWETTQSFTYDAGNSCLSCHKTDLPRLAAPVTASKLDSSAHRTLTCGQCHPDFRYDDGANKTKLWNVNAGLACATTCHDHDKQQLLWKASIHGSRVTSDSVPAATCSGCHGGHDIERLKTQAAKDRLRLSGQQMCVGSCHAHEAAYASYNDWWHGAAYKSGALDAPACWTCHGAHDTRALKDPASMTSPEKLPETCGQKGCHQGSGEAFAEGGRTLVHGRTTADRDNPVVALRERLFPSSR